MRRTRTAWHLAAYLVWTIPAAPAPAEPAPARPVSFSSAIDLPAPAREAWEATVLLATRTWDHGAGTPRLATGSGLVLDREADTIWIATSSHVVPCPGACLIRVHLPRTGGGSVSATAELSWRDRHRDLALLRATAPRKAAIRVAPAAGTPAAGTPAAGTPAAGTPAAGTPVLAIGFPDLSLLFGDRRGGRRAAKRYSTGRLLSAVTGLRADYFSYGSQTAAGRLDLDRALTHSAALLPGSSGGPLIDSDGRVLGINTGSLTTPGDQSCADRREACRVHLAVPIGELLRKVEELRSSGL